MKNQAHERYKLLMRQLETDEEYLALMERLRENEPDFRAALDALCEEQRTAIIEHLGICAELAERTTELSCFIP